MGGIFRFTLACWLDLQKFISKTNLLSLDVEMRKVVFVLVAVLCLGLIGLWQVVEVADANPIPSDWMNPVMTVTLHSPADGAHYTSSVQVDFSAQGNWPFTISDDPTAEWQQAFFYVLDNQNMATGVRFPRDQLTWTPGQENEFTGQATLTDLEPGSHSNNRLLWGGRQLWHPR